jgi:nitrate reductase NapE component
VKEVLKEPSLLFTILFLIAFFAYYLNFSHQDRRNQWLSPLLFTLVIIVLTVFYLIGHVALPTDISLLDNTAKQIVNWLDQKSVRYEQIFSALLGVALIIEMYLIYVLDKTKLTRAEKVFNLILVLVAFFMLAKIENPEIKFVLSILFLYLVVKAAIMIMITVFQKLLPEYFMELTKEFAVLFYRGENCDQIDNKYISIRDYLLFVAIGIYLLLYVAIVGEFFFVIHSFGHFNVFALIIIFEFALYLGASFESVKTQIKNLSRPLSKGSVDLKQLCKTYRERFEKGDKFLLHQEILSVAEQTDKTAQLPQEIQALKDHYASIYSEGRFEYFQAFANLYESFDKESINLIIKNTFPYQYESYLSIFLEYLVKKEKNILIVFNGEEEQQRAKKKLKKIFHSHLLSVDPIQALTHKGGDRLKYAIIADTSYEINRHFHATNSLQDIDLVILLDLDATLHQQIIQTRLLLYKFVDAHCKPPSILAFSRVSSPLEVGFNQQFGIYSGETKEIKVGDGEKELLLLSFKQENRAMVHTLETVDLAHPIEDIIALASIALQKETLLSSVHLASDFMDIKNDIELLADGMRYGVALSQKIIAVDGHCFDPLEEEDVLFIVSDQWNLIKTVQKWQSYVKAQQLLLITLSPRYLLREYLAKNIQFFLKKPYIKDLILHGALEEKQVAYLLYRRLEGGYVDKQSIARGLGIKESEVSKFEIAHFLNQHLDIMLDKDNFTFEDRDIFEEREFQKVRYYKIINIDASQILSSNRYGLTSHNTGEVVQDITIDEDDIYTKYLPHQIHLFANTAYRVQHIDQNFKRMQLVSIKGEEITHDKVPKAYTLTLQKSHHAMQSEQIGNYRLIKKELLGTVAMRIERYYRYYKEGKETIQELDRPLQKEFTKTNIMQVDIVSLNTESTFSDTLRFSLTLLCNEVLCTIFPEHHHLVEIVTKYSDPDYDTLYLSKASICFETREDTITLYLLELTQMDMGLNKTLLEYFEKILQVVDDYLAWIAENQQEENFLSTMTFEGESLASKVELEPVKELLYGLLNNKNEISEQRKRGIDDG